MSGNGNGQNVTHVRSSHSSARHTRAGNFDWDAARQRIMQAIASLAGTEESPQVIATLLEQRTTQLAQVIEKTDLGDQVDLVMVRLGREVFGLEAQYVIDMRPVERVTRVPRVPAWVAGIVNWRGHVTSVLDVRRWWDLPQSEAVNADGAVPYLVMAEASDMSVALIVDNVLAVETVPGSAVQEVGGTVRGLRAEFVRGVVERDQGQDQMVIILDLPAILSDPQLIIHEDIV